MAVGRSGGREGVDYDDNNMDSAGMRELAELIGDIRSLGGERMMTCDGLERQHIRKAY